MTPRDDLFQSIIAIAVFFSRQVYTWNPPKRSVFILIRYGWFRSALPAPCVLGSVYRRTQTFRTTLPPSNQGNPRIRVLSDPNTLLREQEVSRRRGGGRPRVQNTTVVER